MRTPCVICEDVGVTAAQVAQGARSARAHGCKCPQEYTRAEVKLTCADCGAAMHAVCIARKHAPPTPVRFCGDALRSVPPRCDGEGMRCARS